MPGYLLDSTVVHELMKSRPDPRVVDWADATPESLLHLSVITLGELRKGIDLLPDNSPRRAALLSWLERDFRLRFQGRLLVFDGGVAERWGQIEALARRRGLSLTTVDAQLSATALHHGLTFATRNTGQVGPAGIAVFSPWG